MNKTIGILGGGQLGSMLAESIRKFGARVVVYDPNPHSPAFSHAWRHFCGEWTDDGKLTEFFQACDVVTYEFENVLTTRLRALETATQVPIYPRVGVLEITQDRRAEKRFMESAGLPFGGVEIVEKAEDLARIAQEQKFPVILKTAGGGYDGKGQWLLQNAASWEARLPEIRRAGLPAVCEELVPLALEVSCIVARSSRDAEVVFPVFENHHRDHILDLTFLPARIPSSVAEKVRLMAVQAARQLGVEGLLTVEFFLTRSPCRGGRTETTGDLSGLQTLAGTDGWWIYVNEFAPRPHNSGHVTRNACTMSQFDALARILLRLPLHGPQLHTTGVFCMGNLLGDTWISQSQHSSAPTTPSTEDLDLAAWQEFPDVIDVTLYGKGEPKSKRKMGHFVTVGSDHESVGERALRFRERLASAASLRP